MGSDRKEAGRRQLAEGANRVLALTADREWTDSFVVTNLPVRATARDASLGFHYRTGPTAPPSPILLYETQQSK